MIVANLFTMLLVASAWINNRILDYARILTGYIDFQEIFLDVILGFLPSTALVGIVSYYTFNLPGLIALKSYFEYLMPMWGMQTGPI